MIKFLMIGHIGRDAEVRSTDQGKTVISFNVAHTDKWKNAQGVDYSKTTWVNCSYWTEKTGIAPYLKKGTQVYLEGIVDAQAYMNKQGEAVAQLTLRVASIQLLGSKSEGGAGSSGNQSQSAAAAPAGYRPVNTSNSVTDPDDINQPLDDLPF